MNCSRCSQCNGCRACDPGCDDGVALPNGDLPIRFGGESWTDGLPERCPGCNCERGRTHHRACLIEQCPKCHLSLLGACGCWRDYFHGSGNPEDELEELHKLYQRDAE